MESKTFRVTTDLLASQGQRLGNYLLDLIIQYALIFLLAIVLVVFADVVGNSELSYWVGNMSTVESYVVGYVVMFFYYGLTEVFLSRSIAKFVTKTVVVNQNGAKPDSGTIVKRTLCRMIPFNHFSFLGGGRGWHDSISETYVVKKDLLEEKKRLFYAFDEIGQTES